ncbi:MAG TPA: DNA repair protein RecO [Candidatus Paceibacterota bacterium]|jgi:DNA repair protein RecO (recombination protein O)
MAHLTYKTKGLVLDTHGVGEEHLFVVLLTEELGLVSVVARSARSLRSRFRYHVQPMSFGEYSLVRGREVWRLIGARAEYNLFYELRSNTEAIRFIGRYAQLLRRLLAGEEAVPELFALIGDALSFLRKENPQGELLQNLEYIAVLRSLLALGYIGEHRTLGEALRPSPITTGMLTSIAPLRRTMALEINRALKESHL